MPLHIVTSKCFLTCDRITFIKLEEFPAEDGRGESHPYAKTTLKKKKVGRPKKKVELKIDYKITIGYYPVTTRSSGNYEPAECVLELKLSDKQKINSLYAEIVKEVQEQQPNEGYLDTLVKKMLDNTEFQIETVEPEF